MTSASTSEACWNTISPFGGVTVATILHAILRHPRRLGDPVALKAPIK